MDKISYLGHTLTRWQVGQSTFLALPEKGARLMNWNLTLGDGSVRDVIYWPESKTLDDVAATRGGNPILFPFSGRSYDKGEIYFWRAPDGVRRPMPMHGFARQADFKIVDADARGFTAQLIPNAVAREAYPFDYEFTVAYRFEAFRLTCEMTLRNLGEVPLPWSPGHHFYFTVPWEEGTSRADYTVRIAAAERLRRDPAGQLIAGPVLQTDENLTNPGLVDTMHTGLRHNEAVVGVKGRPGDVIVKLGTAKIPPADSTFVTWTADEKSPFYCVEPWMGPPNAPEHKRGLQLVAPREASTFTVSVTVK